MMESKEWDFLMKTREFASIPKVVVTHLEGKSVCLNNSQGRMSQLLSGVREQPTLTGQVVMLS